MFDVKTFKKRTFNFILVFLILFSSLFFNKTLAKYTSNIREDAVVAVAKPIIMYDGLNNSQTVSLSLPLEEINPTMGIKTYTFDVTNTNNGNVTEVDLNYEIIITTTNNLPLNYHIICADAIPTEGIITSTMVGSPLNVTFDGSFSHSISATHTYTIEINWQENENDYNYSNEIDEINIIVNWYQA